VSHWPPDYCFEQLKQHREVIAASAGTNEADTRLRAINTMLFEVLGWDVLDVNVEKYVRAVGYADYAMHVDGSFAMIVEAKKADESFVVPVVAFPAGSCGFGLVAKESPEADKALRQAIGYAASLGVRYVGITTGTSGWSRSPMSRIRVWTSGRSSSSSRWMPSRGSFGCFGSVSAQAVSARIRR
jgi:hypothetical protein